MIRPRQVSAVCLFVSDDEDVDVVCSPVHVLLLGLRVEASPQAPFCSFETSVASSDRRILCVMTDLGRWQMRPCASDDHNYLQPNTNNVVLFVASQVMLLYPHLFNILSPA